MKIILQITIILLVLLLFSNTVCAYEKHEPIKLKDIHATAEDPYIIEGYEITNPTGDCLIIMNSEHIIIRQNYFHDCGTDENFQKQTDHYKEGYASLIGNSSNIVFENNELDNNFRGFMAYNTPNLKAKNNKIINTIQYSPLWCERCSDSEFSFNYLSDNGDPTHFWVPSDRSIGIWIKRSDNVEIHDNTVIRSTSDGISATGHIYGPSFTVPDTFGKSFRDDYTGYCNNIRIYNNLILDNLEQGVWLVNARNIKVFNNTIRTGCFTYGAPILTEFNVGDSEFYNNKFLGCINMVIGGANSFNIYVHDNTYYSFKGKEDFMHFSDDPLGVGGSAMRQGAEFQDSYGNTEKDNIWQSIEGILAEEMQEKIGYAEEHRTHESKGWIACEGSDGVIDEECVIREEAKGNQGVPKEQLFYSSLMENFDDFAVENIFTKFVSKEKKQATENNDSILDELKESWQATLIFLFIIVLIIIAVIVYRKSSKK